MQFVRRLRTVWSWLPAFRAVAETQHLPSAAQELAVVPSSLSRMVKQLEDELGVDLFDRTSKAMVLNERGRQLLVAVREAMRLVDDALGSTAGSELVGSTGAIASGELVNLVLAGACARLALTQPDLTVNVMRTNAEDASAMLLRGDADAALLDELPPPHPDLRAAQVATFPRAVFATSPVTTPVRCAMVGRPSAHADDGWPAEVAREVRAWAPDERTALELCARGDLATVAFEAAPRVYGLGDRLIKLDFPVIPPRAIHLVSRRAIGRHLRTEKLVEAIRRAVSELDGP